jgi:hypothetical protein
MTAPTNVRVLSFVVEPSNWYLRLGLSARLDWNRGENELREAEDRKFSLERK